MASNDVTPAIGPSGADDYQKLRLDSSNRLRVSVEAFTAGTITVSGTVAATQSGAWNITNITGTISLPTGAATAALQTQPGVDIGDVTVNNAAGAAAVNIQDGGNSITVDGTVSISGTVTVSGTIAVSGTVAVTQSGSWSVTADTELPAAAVLADAAANPTTPTVGSALLGFNGTTFDRLKTMPAADNSANLGFLAVGLVGFDGTNYDRIRGTSALGLQVQVMETVSATVKSTNIAESSVSVGASSTALVTASGLIRKIFIQNHGTGYVRVSLSGTATLTSPIRLVPQVGIYTIESDGAASIYQGAISAISESGTNEVGVIKETM